MDGADLMRKVNVAAIQMAVTTLDGCNESAVVPVAGDQAVTLPDAPMCLA